MNRSKAPAATWEDEERMIFETDTSWDREIRIFFDAIENDMPILSGSSTQALEVMRLVDRIYAHERYEADVLYKDLNGGLFGRTREDMVPKPAPVTAQQES
jgi:hypothetical protein